MDLYLAAQPRDRGPVAGEPPLQFLCFSWEALTSLQRLGFTAAPWKDYFPAAEASIVIERSARAAGAWYEDDGRDFTAFAGVSLGLAHRWTLCMQTVRPAYTFLASLLEAVEKHAPKTVYCEKTNPRIYRDTLLCAENRSSFRVEWVEISKEASGHDASWRASRTIYGPSKRLAAGLLNWLIKRGSSSARSNRDAVLISYYHCFDDLLQAEPALHPSFRLVLAELPPKKHFGAVLRNGMETWLEPWLPRPLSKAESRAIAEMRQVWKKARAKPGYAARFEWNGISLFKALEPAIEAFLAEGAAPLAQASTELSRLWQTDPPAAVLLAFPGPSYQNLLEQAARAHRTPTAVLLHGLPGDYANPVELPEEGTLIAWGEEQKRIYDNHAGRAKSKVALAGNPYFDRYARARPARPFTGLRDILIISNPTTLPATLAPERHASMLVDALQKIDGARLILKLHPSDSLPYYEKLLAGRRVKVAKTGLAAGYLGGCDLMVGGYSTTLLEAMILDRPILLVNLTGEPYPPPFDGAWGIEPITSAGRLAEAIDGLRGDFAAFSARVRAAYPRILDRFAGPIDGQATRRLQARIEELLHS